MLATEVSRKSGQVEHVLIRRYWDRSLLPDGLRPTIHRPSITVSVVR